MRGFYLLESQIANVKLQRKAAMISYPKSDEIAVNDETDSVSLARPSLPNSCDPNPKTWPSLLTTKQCLRVPDTQTILYPQSSETGENFFFHERSLDPVNWFTIANFIFS